MKLEPGDGSPRAPDERAKLSLDRAIAETTTAFLDVGSVDADIWKLAARCIEGLAGAIAIAWSWDADRSQFEMVDEPADLPLVSNDSLGVQVIAGKPLLPGPIHLDVLDDPSPRWPNAHDRRRLAPMFEALRIDESCFLPVIADDQTLGMLLVGRRSDQPRWSLGDLARAQHVAACSALALDRARLTRENEELRAAPPQRRDHGPEEVLDHLRYAAVTTDMKGVVTGWNSSAGHMYGIPTAAAIGRHVSDLVSTVPTGKWNVRSIGSYLRRNRTWSGELDQISADGRRLHVSVMSTVVDGPGTDRSSIVTIVRDKNDWRTEIERSQATARSMLDALPAPTVLVDANGFITATNRAWRYAALARDGTDEACGVGVNYLDVCARAAESGDEGAAQTLDGILGVLRGDHAIFTLDYECGHEVLEWFSLKAYPLDQGGAVIGHYDITQSQQRAAELAWVAAFDKVTELPNRGSLTIHLEHELAASDRKVGGRVGVVLADIARFRIINDSLGHNVGDEVLRRLAERLIETVRPDDYVARFSGGVFAVVARRQETGEFDGLADEISSAVARPLEVRGRELIPRVTIGVAIGLPGAHAETILSVADGALHQQKRRRVGRVSIIEIEENEQVAELDAELELREAIASGQLELDYQAIVNTHDAVPRGFEALVRWNHPERGRIPPDSFIPLAEDSGLIVPLGEWVLDTAIATAATWPKELSVSVNLSPLQVADTNLIPMIEGALERHGFDPGRLILEVTERSLISEDPTMTKPITELRGMGIRISIDDFGTGYSSLAYLRILPADVIKIDKSFIDEIPGLGEPIVAAIINLADALKLEVIAEGVEDAAQFTCLRDLGCDAAQGFHLHRPTGPTDLGAYLDAAGVNATDDS